MNTVAPASTVLGDLCLCHDARTLVSQHGEVVLGAMLYRLAERLMRQPGVIVGASALVSAMYPDPDREPERADLMLRKQVQLLRSVILVLTRERVQVRTERDVGYSVGYAMEVRR